MKDDKEDKSGKRSLADKLAWTAASGLVKLALRLLSDLLRNRLP